MLKIFFQSGEKIGGCCAVVTVRCSLAILKKLYFPLQWKDLRSLYPFSLSDP